MKVEEKGHTTIIHDNHGDALALLEKLAHDYPHFSGKNLILDLSADKSLSLKSLAHFRALSKEHKKGKKSFVIVAGNIDFTAVPADIVVVPTLLEAHDVIEMEEIERDLGF
jgi:hypothetical protein